MMLIDADEIRIKPKYMHDICGSVMIRVEDISRIINDMPTINPQKWIPVSERPPEEFGEYLVTVKTIGWNLEENTEIDIAYWDDLEGFHKAEEVIAWMPLPEPYKENKL